MRIWKMLGWDTKDARTERNVNNNQARNFQTLIWAGVWVLGFVAATVIWT